MVTEFQRLPSFLKISGSAPDGVFLSPNPHLPHLWAAPKKLILTRVKGSNTLKAIFRGFVKIYHRRPTEQYTFLK